ncbi:MAG: lipoyl(octanoyl) transferase LipB [Sphingobacteriaceae bacterium]|nr:MAG: lipoyl(octanoyl) transferase LipB [Sphingobacteriaceae bacterium]
MNKETVAVADLGTTRYQPVWEYQEKLLQENVQLKASQFSSTSNIITTATHHHLLLTEHLPVYTLGKSGKKEHILISPEEMEKKEIEYFHINRGGDITFHGPGQLVGYPVLDLEKFGTDIGKYLRNLEEVIIRTIAHFGLKGDRSKGETGVWLNPDQPGKERKICAMGIRCSRWITMHGWALNVNTDLSYFKHIVPCGIQNKQVTSIKKELGYEVPIPHVKKVLLKEFAEVFEVELAIEKTPVIPLAAATAQASAN